MAVALLATTVAAVGWVLVRRATNDERLRAVARVGKEYLRSQGIPRDEGSIVALVPTLGGRTGADALARLDEQAAAVRRDFETGDIVCVDGWRLSRTEALAAALIAAGHRRRVGGSLRWPPDRLARRGRQVVSTPSLREPY